MPSIREVAKKANVSAATVSRVLNNNKNVKEETYDNVLKVIEEMDYTPNMLGVNLKNGSNNLIVVIVPVISNPFYSTLVDGIENCAAYHGYKILTAVTNGVMEKEIEYYEMAKNKLADGVLALTSALDAETLNKYAEKIPIIRCSHNPVGTNVPMVGIDDEKAVCDVVNYLYECGRRNIAYMGISKDAESSITPFYRESGYRNAIKELGLPFDSDMIAYSGYEYFSGLVESEKLIKAHPEIDAIVCATDIMAFNAIRTLQFNGKHVPSDVAVTGFDNSTYSLLSSPKITSVDQANYETGYRAMESLYRQISTGKIEDKVINIPHRIVKRESTDSNCKKIN